MVHQLGHLDGVFKKKSLFEKVTERETGRDGEKDFFFHPLIHSLHDLNAKLEPGAPFRFPVCGGGFKKLGCSPVLSSAH